tara:strand:- start:1816 stop:2730 length:915 start_codon:yes stop_codon:yes gene_type:complete
MRKKFRIGIDYGGTKIEAILIDDIGKEIERVRFKNDKDYHSGIKSISNLVKEFESKVKENCTVGIGIPGFSSKETGLINNANSIWLNNKHFKNDLEKSLKKEVKIMNDANCFTLSESIDGAGQNYKSVFGIIIGTGLGSGLSYNKEIIEGVNQVAGDWGHQPLPYATEEEIKTDIICPVPNCKKLLCAEQFISGSGFEKNFNKKYNTNYSSSEIVQLDLQGDYNANKELALYEDRLSRLIAIMIGIFDPEAIILGGGMSNIKRLYDNIPKIIPKYTFSDKVRNKILKNKHGDSSGVRGAAWLWN